MNSTCEAETRSVRALAPYPVYKDSGVESLGKVPEQWEVRRLRNAVRMRVSNVDKHVREGETPVRLCNYVDVYYHDCISERSDFMRATATPEEIAQFRLEEGDVLITKDSEAWDDIGVPAVVTDPAEDLISGYHLALLRPFADVLIGGYLLRALQSKGVAHQFHVEAKGVTRYGLPHAAIKSVRLVVPPLAEQRAIVRFIDRVDRRIRHYIRAKQRLIELLEEQKQAIIHQAVTGQIDVRTGRPYPTYKNSSVEWLREVPEHWEIRRIKNLVATSRSGIQMGPFGASLTNLQHQDTGFKVYGQENTISGDFHRGSRWITEQQFKKLCRYELVPDDLVLTRKGSIGKCRLAPSDLMRGIVDSDTIRVRLNREIVGHQFMVVVLHRAAYLQWQIESVQRGAVLGGLNTFTIANLRVALPPLREQAEIVTMINSSVGNLRAVANSIRRQIQQIAEYGTRLIADIVTGKLDVREAATSLSEIDPFAVEDTLDGFLGRNQKTKPDEPHPALT